MAFDLSTAKPVNGAKGFSFKPSRPGLKGIAEQQGIVPPVAGYGPERGINAGQALRIGAGRGFVNLGRAVGYGDMEEPITTDAMDRLEAAHPIAVPLGEAAAESAPFILPGMKAGAIASTPLRVMGQMIVGGTEAGLITRGKGYGEGEQALAAGVGGTLAGGLELVLPHLGRLGGKVIRKAFGRAPKSAVVDAAGKPSTELLSALDEVGMTFDEMVDIPENLAADPRQIARKALFDSEGITPLKAQITRDPGDFQKLMETAKGPGRARSALEAQDAILSNKFDQSIASTGGEAVRDESSIFRVITDKAETLKKNINDLYATARERSGADKSVRFSRLASKLRALAGSDSASGGVVSAITGDLKARGILDDAMKVRGRIDVETAEKVRVVMNELYDPQKGYGNGILKTLKESLDEDVFSATGDDLFKAARKANTDYEQELARAKISRFDKRKQNIVKSLLENTLYGDDLVKKGVFGGAWRPDDLQQVKDYIGTSEAGRAAWNDLRAETLDAIKLKSFGGVEDAEGFTKLSYRNLDRALKAIGRKKMNVLFSPNEVAALDRLREISKMRVPVSNTGIGDGPTGVAVNKLRAEVRRGSLVAELLDTVTLDRHGRAAIKATPKALPVKPGKLQGALDVPKAAIIAGGVASGGNESVKKLNEER